MSDGNCPSISPRRIPWNKDKLIGAKPPLRPNRVWSIRTRLLIARRARDLKPRPAYLAGYGQRPSASSSCETSPLLVI